MCKPPDMYITTIPKQLFCKPQVISTQRAIGKKREKKKKTEIKTTFPRKTPMGKHFFIGNWDKTFIHSQTMPQILKYVFKIYSIR